MRARVKHSSLCQQSDAPMLAQTPTGLLCTQLFHLATVLRKGIYFRICVLLLAFWLLGFLTFGLLGFLAFRLLGFLASRRLGFLALCWFMRLLAAFCPWLFASSAFPVPLRQVAFWLYAAFGGFGFLHPLLPQFLSGLFGLCTLSLFFGFGFPHHQHHQFLPI